MTVATALTGTDIATHGWQTQALCSLWRVYRKDGVVEYYTDWDEDIVRGVNFAPFNPGEVTFLSVAGGVSATADEKEVGFRPQNMDIVGFIDGIDEDDLHQGRYGFARIDKWQVDARWPHLPPTRHTTFWVVKIEYSGEDWTFHLEGLGRRLQETYGTPFNRTCRFTLGGPGCNTDRTGTGPAGLPSIHPQGQPPAQVALGGIALDITAVTYGYTTQLAVSYVESGFERRVFAVNRTSGTPNAPLGRPYKYGRVQWVTGNNAGRIYEIGWYDAPGQPTTADTGLFHTAIAMGGDVQVGDTCILVEGCDGTSQSCHGIRDNIQNHGAFHLIPGPTRAHQAPRPTWK